MTNKTREKIEKIYSNNIDCGEVVDGCVFLDQLEKLFKQSENRILRKWKKAIETSNTFGVNFISRKDLEREYLKAKGGKK